MSVRRPLPRWADVALLPVLNLLLALIVFSIFVALIGQNPFQALAIMVNGAFGYGEGVGFTLHFATSFVFTGLAVAVAAHAGLFNIGGEGQAYVASLGAIAVGFALDHTVWWLVLPLAIFASMIVGAAWAFIPGYLQAKRGSHVVITTIMFNFIASALMIYLLVNVMSPIGSMNPETRPFDPNAHLPLMHDVFAGLGIEIARTPLNLSFVWALICAVVVWLMLWHTTLGYQLRVLGANPSAATYAGMKP